VINLLAIKEVTGVKQADTVDDLPSDEIIASRNPVTLSD
jgi:hypothetical protein